MRKIALIIVSILGFSLPAFASSDPEVVPSVDFQRYQGLWYEVAHSPNFFQRKCDRSTAEYGLQADGILSVFNTCYKDNKVISTIRGSAWAPDPKEPGKLVVDFALFREGDYWIVKLDNEYQWVVVSGPSKASIFILTRKAPMAPVLQDRIIQTLRDEGYDVEGLIYDKY